MVTTLVRTLPPLLGEGYYIYIGGGFMTLLVIVLVVVFLLRR